MSLNAVIENPEYKLLFLKAIKLGIMYGQSDKSNFYKEKIDYEINSIIFSKNTEEVQTVKQENIQQSDNSNKNDIIMMNLENQRNIIIKNTKEVNLDKELRKHAKKLREKNKEKEIINIEKQTIIKNNPPVDKFKEQYLDNIIELSLELEVEDY